MIGCNQCAYRMPLPRRSFHVAPPEQERTASWLTIPSIRLPLRYFRPPHDHGRAWVVYGVQSGELELRTYARVQAAGAEDRLVLRDTSLLRAGEAKAYLPGDIHDTRCLTENALLFRFTERDLRYEDQVEHKLSRFVERDGYWTAPRP